MAGKGGGAWKVAYADFVTAMMAFFLVMWITAQNKPVKQAIARYFQDPFGTSDEMRSTAPNGPEGAVSTGPHDHPGGPKRGMTASVALNTSTPGKTGVASREQARALASEDGERTGTGTNIIFPEESAELDEAGRARLEALVPRLLGKPNKIEIRGHASRRPLPPDNPMSDPWQASYARCLAAMRFLIEHGVEADRIRLSQAGTSEPRTRQRGALWQARNARVEIHVLDEFVAGPDRTPSADRQSSATDDVPGDGINE